MLDPGTPVRSERAGVRRAVLLALREVAESLRVIISTWNNGRQVWDGGRYRPTRGGLLSQPWRWRRWGEYPENNPIVLAQHAERLHQLGSAMITLSVQLSEQADDDETPAPTSRGRASFFVPVS
jgi:hypothetical protein